MLNLIAKSTESLTMGTREIAEMIGSNNRDIKKSAERLHAAGILTATLSRLEFEHKGNIYFEYRLCKRDCFVLVAQNSPEFTAKIVDRWIELESAQQASAVPQTY
ncbi:MAG: phage regulatory protein/antirepressor Ant, partial [Plesiomonas shigelloides]